MIEYSLKAHGDTSGWQTGLLDQNCSDEMVNEMTASGFLARRKAIGMLQGYLG